MTKPFPLLAIPVISLVVLGGVVLFFLLRQTHTQENLIPTKETATLCTLEEREECKTGLVLAINPCEEDYYKEACDNIALAILNDPNVFLANPYPLQGKRTHTKPDAWLTYTQKNPESGSIILEPSSGYTFIDDRPKSDDFLRSTANPYHINTMT